MTTETTATKPKVWKVAVIDGHGRDAEVHLAWRDRDGNWFADIEWPWASKYVTSAFLRQQGYRVITA